MLASRPAVKKPVPKIDLSLHHGREATEYLKSSQLGWESCSFLSGSFSKLKALYVKTM